MFVATNQTDDAIPFRDDAGKHFIGPGETITISGDQHADGATLAGLDVRWTTEAPVAPAADPTPQPVSRSRGRRKAQVTVRDE